MKPREQRRKHADVEMGTIMGVDSSERAKCNYITDLSVYTAVLLVKTTCSMYGIMFCRWVVPENSVPRRGQVFCCCSPPTKM